MRVAAAVIVIGMFGCCCPSVGTIAWAIWVTQSHVAFADACKGTPVRDATSYDTSDGPHLVVALERVGLGFTPSYDLLSDDVQAWSIGGAQLALCLEPERVVAIETCPSGVVRSAHTRDAKLVVARDARVLAVETLTGELPEPCNKLTASAIGGELDEDVYDRFLVPFVGTP